MFNDGKSRQVESFGQARRVRAAPPRFFAFRQSDLQHRLEKISISNGIGWSLDGKFFSHRFPWIDHLSLYFTRLRTDL